MLPTILGILFSLLIVALLAYCLLIATLFVARVLTEPTNVLCKCTARLDGKLVIVTGGNSGIGFQTAKDLANRGAKVIIADVNNSDASVKNIIEATGNEKVEYRNLDLADFKSVRTFAEDINKTLDRLDILVNNAGILTENNYITKDGAAITMQVNYLGPFLLTSLLMDKLTRTKSRIVIVASEVHFKGDVDLQDISGVKTKNFLKSYLNSKLCTVLWTKGLSKRLPANVSVFCLHPGIVSTNIFALGYGFIGRFAKMLIGWLIKTPYEGAQTTTHACVAPNVENMSGGYFVNCKLTPTGKVKNEENLIEELWNETILFLKERVK